MLSLLDSTVLSASNLPNAIRGILRNTADSIAATLGYHSKEIKEPTSEEIKEPNPDGTNGTTHKRYKSYKRSYNVLIYFDY